MAGREGVIWAAGYGYDPKKRVEQWLVRRRSKGGPWTTADVQPGHATAVTVAPTGTIFVAGVQDQQWVVRRSNDGKTWATVDRFQGNSEYPSQPRAIAADADGNVYVAGYAEMNDYDSDNVHLVDATRWVVRSSRDGGLHFSTIDDFTLAGRGETRADGITVLPSGTVVVVGGGGVPQRRILRFCRAAGPDGQPSRRR